MEVVVLALFGKALKWASDSWNMPSYLSPSFLAFCIWNAAVMVGAPAAILEH